MRRFLLPVLLLCGALSNAQNIFTITGIPVNHRDDVDGVQALSAPLGYVYAVLIDKTTGRLLLNDESLVLRVEPDGSLLTLAGSSLTRPLYYPAGSDLASGLSTEILRGMAQDSGGDLYLSDAEGGRVYKVTPGGIVSTFAGGGSALPGFPSDGGPATSALLVSPRGLAFDSKGNLIIAEVYCNCIRSVTPQGVISTVYTLPASSAPGGYQSLEGLAVDGKDNIYYTTWEGNTVGRVASDGTGATIIAGTGKFGFSGDGGPAAAAQLGGPSGVTVDSSGNVYVADTLNNRIRKIGTDGAINTIAGSTSTCGFAGDGGPALSAQFCDPAEVIFDASGNLVIADYANHRVRVISAADGTITTVAGSGQFDPANSVQSPAASNGGPAIHATFNMIGGAAFDSAGNLFISDSGANFIREIAANGTVSAYAGIGFPIYSGDGGPASQAGIIHPGPLAISPDGSLYIVTNDQIRKITPDGIIHAVAGAGPGIGINRSQGDGGPAVNATLNEPGGVAFDQRGNVYIADTSNARVRKVDTNGIITTVAGPGQGGVDYYNAVAVDPKGNLYVSWTHLGTTGVSATVNLVNADGTLTRVAGTGAPCVNGPGQWTYDGLALQARLCAVTSMSTGPDGLLYLSEGAYALELRLNADGTIQRVAGNASTSVSPYNVAPGDGGPALQAGLAGGQGFSPQAATFDPAGNMYLPEAGLNIIREVTSASYTLPVFDPLPVTGTTPQTITVNLPSNFAEEFPYSVKVSTGNNGAWLSVNRVSGVTGEPIKITVNGTGLVPGTYTGAVTVTFPIPAATPQQVNIPVSLRVLFTPIAVREQDPVGVR